MRKRTREFTKRIFATLMCFVLLVIMVGCQGGTADTSADRTGESNTTENVDEDTGESKEQVAVDEDLPQITIAYPTLNPTRKMIACRISNVDYYQSNIFDGSMLVVNADNSDPDSLIKGVEEAIAAGAQGIVFTPPNNTCLVKISQLCEAAGVYWTVNYREVLDEEVRDYIWESPYFVGNIFQDDYQGGYDVIKDVSEAGYTKVAMISMDKSDTTSINRESGMNKACEEFGVEVVAEARSLSQSSEAAAAVESFIVTHPETEVIFIVGTLGTGVLGGVQSALDQYDPDGKIKICMIDFLEGFEESLATGRILSAYNMHVVPVMVAATTLINNAVLNGERMLDENGEAPTIRFKMAPLGSEQELEYFNTYVEGDLPWFDSEYYKNNLLQKFNPDFDVAALQKIMTEFDINALADANQHMQVPHGNYDGVSNL